MVTWLCVPGHLGKTPILQLFPRQLTGCAQTVLEGSTLEEQRRYFGSEGSFSSAAWDNRVALEAWIDMLEGRSGEHTNPARWIRQMTSEDPKARPSAEYLFQEIINDDPTYSGTCCGEDEESGASGVDSYAGSETDDDEVFTTNSNTNTRSTAMASPPLTQTSTLQSPSEKVDTNPWDQIAEQQQQSSIAESQAEKVTTGSSHGQEHRNRRDESSPVALKPNRLSSFDMRNDATLDDQRTSQPSTTVRDPEGNEIRKTLKRVFSSDAGELEAHVISVSQRREDWEDLLLQAIRPQDVTTNRYTILHALSRFEEEGMACEVLRVYLDEGAEVDAPDFSSSTPLHHAAYRGRVRIVESLLNAGAKCASTNFRKRSALGLACTEKNEEVAQLLINKMSTEEMNMKDAGGWTPLHHACANGSSLLVKALLEAGADSLAMDRAKLPPFWRCDASITTEISDFHREWRAKSRAPESLESPDTAATSWWSTCDINTTQSDGGILKGQRASTTGREPAGCLCSPCVVLSLAKQLSDAGSMPRMTCACSRHIKETTDDILSNVATIETTIHICACKTCTEARQDCGKQSTAPVPIPTCQCSWCSSQNAIEKNVTYIVPDLTSCDSYQGHEHYDNEIQKALPSLCDCEECQKVRYSNAIGKLAEKGFKGAKSYRSEPKIAWTSYIEECLELAEDRRKRPISSMMGDVLTILLDWGANIYSTSQGFTMLHAAVLAGNVTLAKLLIERQADLDMEAKDGERALMMALTKQDSRMLRLLLRSGAQVRSTAFEKNVN